LAVVDEKPRRGGTETPRGFNFLIARGSDGSDKRSFKISKTRATKQGVTLRWFSEVGSHPTKARVVDSATSHTDKTRKETNAHAESLMKIVAEKGKACLWQKGLPPQDHVNSFKAAVWLLNRFPPVAALARNAPDGDVARPIEMLTYGWYSRRQINLELCNFVLPGTLVLAHNSSAKGSNVDITKSEWVVVCEMLQKQLVVWSPETRRESKIDSYTLVDGPKGVN
jgi:hypothetical protein